MVVVRQLHSKGVPEKKQRVTNEYVSSPCVTTPDGTGRRSVEYGNQKEDLRTYFRVVGAARHTLEQKAIRQTHDL